MSDTDNTSSNWTPPTAAELQAMLPQYEVTALWGRGGMGAVYKGRQKSLHRDVAIKVLPENFAAGGSDSDPHQFVERFKLEARSMANLDHPAILSVHDFGQTEKGQLYLVMEFVDGMDIHAYLQHHGGKLPEEHAIAICSHVLDALQYAHDSGVIHRDIKPSNVLINSQGRVKLADFGLAKRIAEEGDEDDSGAPLTMENVAVGTPDFVAPEALEKERLPDGRSDLYAVGVMLYQLLTGKLPRGQFELPSDLLPEIDPRFDDVVTRALQANPDSRYGSATEFRGDLDRILSQPIPKAADPTSAEIPLAQLAAQAAPTPKQTPGPAEPEKSKAPLFVSIGLAALLLIGVGVYFLTRPADDDVEGTTGSVVRAEPAPPEPKSTPKENLVASTKTADGQGRPSLPDTTRPAPEPEKPATPPKPPVEPAGPEPKPEPEPESVKPAPAPASTPPDIPAPSAPTAPAEPESETTNAQLAAVPGLKKRLDGYLSARRTALEELAASYLRGLNTRMNQAADAGNLKLTKAYRGEKKRVEELQKGLKEKITDAVAAVGEGATLPALASDAPDGLVSLRKIWTTERQKIRADLNGKLQQSLKALESELTRARELEQAEMVLAYREGHSGKPSVAIASAPEPVKPSPPSSDPASAANTAMASHRATRDKPFENSLGMRFVPVPITGGPSDGKLILFSIWETRVQDYEDFIKEDRKREWPKPAFEQDDDHPAVNVSWDDAGAFCEWLTEKERKAGKMGKDEAYRLPSDHEWSFAIGIGGEESPEATPETKNNRLKKRYPWGEQWPPSKVLENYCGVERAKYPIDGGQEPITNYDDGYAHTAPVASFEANDFGLHDLGGNVRELCNDWFNPNTADKRSSRGASWWLSTPAYLSSSYRGPQEPDKKNEHLGFRVVLDTGVPAPVATSVTQTQPRPSRVRHDPELSRKAAQHALNKGANVQVRLGGKIINVNPGGDLPDEDFELYAIGYPDNQGIPISDEDLQIFTQATEIKVLNFSAANDLKVTTLEPLRKTPGLTQLTVDNYGEFTRQDCEAVATLKDLVWLEIGMAGQKGPVADLPLMIGSAQLEQLLLRKSVRSPAEFAAIGRQTELRELTFQGNASDEALLQLGELSKLEALNMSHAIISVKGLSALNPNLSKTLRQLILGPPDSKHDSSSEFRFIAENFPKMTHLNLRGEILAEAFIEIGALKDLRIVNFNQAAFTPQHFSAIAECRELGEIAIGRGGITAPDVQALKKLRDLTRLRLLDNGIQLDPGALDAFPQLRKLKKLDLPKSQVTLEQLAALKKELPDCEISLVEAYQ